MGKRRLVQSEDGSYGLYDPATKNVIEIPSTSKLVRSEEGDYGIFTNGKVEELDAFNPSTPKKKDVTASSGQEDSGGFFSKVSDYFANATPSISGLAGANEAKKLAKKTGAWELGIYDTPFDTSLTEDEKIVRKQRLKQRAAIDDAVTSSLLNTDLTTGTASFLAKKTGTLPIFESLASGAYGTLAATAVNVTGSIVDFFQNAALKSAEQGVGTKSQYELSTKPTGYESDRKIKSSEGIAAPLYEYAQTLQSVGNSFMRQAKVDYGISNEDVDKSYSQLIQEGKVSDAFISLGLSSVQQLPQIAALASTGGSAEAVFAGSGVMGLGASIGEEYSKDKDISGGDALVAIGKGLVEGISESIFRTDINALNSLKKIISSEGKEQVKDTFVRGLGGVVKKALAGANEEGVEEIIANVGDFIIDRVADDKFDPAEYNKLLRNSVDAFVLGATSGGVVSGAAARASMTDLTQEQERAIKRYKEVAGNETFSKEIREAALDKIKDIRDYNAGKSYDNYRLIADIEDVNKRAEVIRTLDDIKAEEANQKDLHDESLIAASNDIIAEKKASVDKIIAENINSIYNRSSASIKEQQRVAKETAVNYLQNSNHYVAFNEDNSDLLHNVSTGELVDINDINKATSSLYDMEASVIADDKLTNQEKNYVLQELYTKLDSLESYDKITRNGKLMTSENTQDNREENVKTRAERAKKVRNNRFNGELFKFNTEDGREISLRASVDEKGDVVMSPIRKSFRFKNESESKSNEPFKIKGSLEVGEIERDEDGNLVSANIIDSKGKKSFKTNNEELVSYLQALQARKSLVKMNANGYTVDEDIEALQGNEVTNKLTPYQKIRFRNYSRALKSINPNAQIILYKNEKDMVKGLVEQGFSVSKARAEAKNSMGLHHSGVIHANIAIMDDATVPHEIFHEAVKAIAKSNPEAFIDMKNRLEKMLSKAELTYLQNFSNLYENKGENVKAEEFLSELVGVLTAKRLAFQKTNAEGEKIKVEVDFNLNRSIAHKLILALREFVQKYANKTGNKALIDLANKVGESTNSNEELARFFESFSKSLREGTTADTSYLKQFTKEEVEASYEEVSNKINSEQTYDEGLAVEFPQDIDYTSIDDVKNKHIGDYSFPKTIPMLESVTHPVFSLNEVIKKYDGKVVIITSDATGYGVDSKGEPIYGGFGFSLNAKNVKDGIGFASLNVSTVKSTYTAAYNSYGQGKVAVLIMIQNPSTTINNAYGTKYLFRGLTEIANTNEEDLIKSKEAIANFINSSTQLAKVAKTEAERQQIIDVLNKIEPNMSSEQIADLQKEYIDKTTFDSRKIIGLGIMHDKADTKTNKSTTYSKIALNKLGYNMFSFLKEYGDNTILTDDLIANDKGGYVVGGFELDVLPKGLERDDQIESLQSKGIVHDMFNAKLAGTNHFTLDGLYDVNDNFAKFAKPQNEIDEDKLSKEERDQLVRENYSEDKYYKSESRNKPIEERTYTDLEGTAKVLFKNEILAPKGLLKETAPNVATNVSKGLGFAPTEEAKSEIAKSDYQMMPVSEKQVSQEIEDNVDDGSNNEVEFISQKRTLYHGSPWSFTRFENTKIGTGEGAQAYGYGIYLTEDFEVAKSYAFANQGNKIIQQEYLKFLPDNLRQKAYKLLQNQYTTLNQWKQFLEDNKGFLGLSISKANRQKLYQAFGERNHYTAEVTGKKMEDGIWFNWDGRRNQNLLAAQTAYSNISNYKNILNKKPNLSQEEKDILAILDRIDKEANGESGINFFLLKSGGEMYTRLSGLFLGKTSVLNEGSYDKKLFKAQYLTSALLYNIGIDGIRVPTFYTKGGAKNGKMNYVVFNSDNIKIVKKQTIRAKVAGNKAELANIDVLHASRESMERRQNGSFRDWLNKDYVKMRAQDKYMSIYKKWFERNVHIRKELDRAQMTYAMMMMYNKAGASQFAQLKFANYRNKIYGKLNKDEIKILDGIIQLRRVIAIDTNFDNQRASILEEIQAAKQKIEQATQVINDSNSSQELINSAQQSIELLKKQIVNLTKTAKTKERPAHGKHNDAEDKTKKILSNKETATSTLDKMKNLLGEEVYNEYNKRADEYFKAFSEMLKYKLDNGLIDKATYEMFKNYDYQPRVFLKFSYGQVYEDANGNLITETAMDAKTFFDRGSMLSSEELKKINDGDLDYLDADSARLLQSSLIATEVRVSTNKALKAIVEDSKLANYGFVKEAEYERYKDGTIKLDLDGNPKIQKPSDERFVNMTYKVDGKKFAFQLKNTVENPLADEFNDTVMRDLKSKEYQNWSKWLGAKILKGLATGINIAFPITNIPIDVLSQVHLTNIYQGTISERYEQAMMGTLEMSRKLTAAEFNIGDTSETSNLIYEFAEAGGLMMSLTREYSPELKGNWGKITELLGTFGNISELASKLNAYKTVRDRLVDEYYRDHGYDAIEEDLDKIKTEAAYKARAAMDYHRGGTNAKFLDGFAPYFNVLMQVNKITLSYIKNNKIEFGKKIAGAGVFVMGVTMYNMMVAAGDYDNDDIQRDLINNLVIFNPYKNADGTRGYTKIAVPSTVKWFLNKFQHVAEGIYLKEVLQDPKRIEKWQERTKFIQLPKGDIGQQAISILAPLMPPVLKGILEYGFNYDTWRQREITYLGDKNSPYLQGVDDKNVAEFWKAISDTETGRKIGLSPAKMQKFADDLLPTSNPIISVGYSLLDKSVNKIVDLPESYRSKFNKDDDFTSLPSALTDGIKNRFYGTTDPKKRYKNPEYAEIKLEEADKLYIMHSHVREMIDNDASLHEIREYAKTQGKEYVQGIQNYAINAKKRDRIKYKVYESDYFEMMFAPDATAKAKMMLEFEDSNEIPDKAVYRRDLLRLGILTPSVNSMYKKIKKDELTPTGVQASENE